MKKEMSKTQATATIQEFFNHPSFSSHEVKSIKRLAMKHRIKLGQYRKLFCSKCLSQLKGKVKVTRTHKTIECHSCSAKNKIKI